MKLEKQTIDLMKNFASYSSQFLMKEGAAQKTCTSGKTVIINAEFPQEFPKEFGIYDLTKFLGVLKLFENPELDFDTIDNCVIVKEGTRKFYYFGTPASILIYPEKDLSSKFDDAIVSVTLKDNIINQIKAVAASAGLTHVVLESKEGVLKIAAKNFTEDSSNAFEHIIDDSYDGSEFSIGVQHDFINFIEGTYDVDVIKAGARFTNSEKKITYYAAIAKNSEI